MGNAFGYEGWIGSVSYGDRTFRSHEYFLEGAKTGRGKCTHQKALSVVVRTCFEAGGGAAVDARLNATLDDTVSAFCESEKPPELCCGAKRDIARYAASSRQIKEGCERRPGEADKAQSSMVRELSGAWKADSLSLAPPSESSGKYRLISHLDLEVEEQWSGETQHRGHCSEYQKGPSGYLPRRILGRESARFSADGVAQGDVISGEAVLADISEQPAQGSGDCFMGICSSYDADRKDSAYRSRVDARWYFQKAPCFAVIRKVQGDVTIQPAPAVGEGRVDIPVGPQPPVELGCIARLEHATIVTGAQSRIALDFGAHEFRVGSKSKLELSDPCHVRMPEVGILHGGKFYALFHKLLGSDEPYEIKGTNAVNGARGELQPGMPPARTLLASTAPSPGAVELALADEDGELAPPAGELKGAKVAFFVDNRPGERVRVEVLKGAVELQDGSGAKHVLQAGQVFQWRWSEKLSTSETILLRVDRRMFVP
jgi:hypothetical protein